MMNGCAYRQNVLGVAAAGCGHGEMMMMRRGMNNTTTMPMVDPSIYNVVSDGVVCPKPRRLGILNPSSNWYRREVCDSRAGTELLDMILTEGSYGAERHNSQLPSSPPFFSGSPPSRASNPVIQDARFGNDKPSSPAVEVSSPASACKNGVCARLNFGLEPAAVRVEGFNCHGISAVA